MGLTGMKLAEVVCSCAGPLAKFDWVWGHLQPRKMSFILKSIIKIWPFLT